METQGFEIRRAVPRDVPLILSLIRELARYEKLSSEVIATEEGLREALFGDDPAAESIIGQYGPAPVGFALFFENFSTFAGKRGIYLEDLYVKPEYRGKGFGRELLRAVAKLARERGCGRLEWAALDWNTPAINFYKKLGAVAMDEWTLYRVSGKALERLAEGSEKNGR